MHWAVAHIPASARALSEIGPHGALVLRNDFGTFGWGGPCPPPGAVHHYTFTLTAIDGRGHPVASSKLVPVYKR